MSREIDYMSLNRLRLNLSCDSSLPVYPTPAHKTREHADALRPYLNDSSIPWQNPKIVLNPYGVTPLTALVFFHTDKPCRVTCTVKGRSDVSDWRFHYETPETSHAVPVFGLYADTDNLVRLHIQPAEGGPDDARETELHIRTQELSPEMTNPSGHIFPAITDPDGEIRYVLQLPVSMKEGHLLKLSNGNFIFVNRDICTPTEEAPLPTHLCEADLLGRVFCTYYAGSGITSLLSENQDHTGFIAGTKNTDGSDSAIEIAYLSGAAQPLPIPVFSEHKTDVFFGCCLTAAHTQVIEETKTGGTLLRALESIPFLTTGWLREPVLYKGASIQTASAVDSEYMERTYHMRFSIYGDTLLIETTGNEIQEVVFSKTDRIYQLDLTVPELTDEDARYTLAVPFTEMYSGTYSIVIRFRDGGQEVLADTITLSRTRCG